jgi:hypothetical protein
VEKVRFDRSYFNAEVTIQRGLAFPFIKAALAGPVYIRIVGSARDGSIAIADFSQAKGLKTEEQFKELKSAPRQTSGITEYARRQRESITRHYNYDSYLQEVSIWHIKEFKLRFDGSDKLIKPAHFDFKDVNFVWLKDYTGPTVKNFSKTDRSNEPKFQAVDKLGTPVSIGDFIATTHRNTLYIGKVDRITPSGKSIALISLFGKDPFIVPAGDNIVIIDDKTKARAMMVKLSKS